MDRSCGLFLCWTRHETASCPKANIAPKGARGKLQAYLVCKDDLGFSVPHQKVSTEQFFSVLVLGKSRPVRTEQPSTVLGAEPRFTARYSPW